MNYHPKAFQRGYRGHVECWLSETVFTKVKDLVETYRYKGYQGNAQDALVVILTKAMADKETGINNPDYFAWWLLTCTHTFEWYDPTVLTKEQLSEKRRYTSGIYGPEIPQVKA